MFRSVPTSTRGLTQEEADLVSGGRIVQQSVGFEGRLCLSPEPSPFNFAISELRSSVNEEVPTFVQRLQGAVNLYKKKNT